VVATKATKPTAAKKDAPKETSKEDAHIKEDSNTDAPSEPTIADPPAEPVEEPLIETSAAPEETQEAPAPEIKTEEEQATLKPTETHSAPRPKTPELAQLRNKFETLQTASVTPTRSSNNKPAPHNIKDLISRFN
jgi:hypothetical protein